MAKNTGDNKFRRVDVDQYNEDNYVDEFQEDSGDQGPNESEVQSLLNSKQNVEALQVVLRNPPVNTKSQQVKDQVFNLVMKVLSQFKSSEIEKGVNSLDTQSLDVLMKYIYRGFAVGSDKYSAMLLQWHEKAFAAGDLGCIVRVLTDRKKV